MTEHPLSLGMVWQFDINDNLPGYLSSAMVDVIQISCILDCKTGGLVIQQHNEVRDCLGDMVAQAWSQVVRETIVKEADSKADGPGLRADLGIRGVWTPLLPRWKRCLI